VKYRTGFVANSSSSSFTVPLSALTELQHRLIKRHIGAARLFGFNNGGYPRFEKRDEWDIRVEGETLYGYTHLDNFNMQLWMQEMGIPMGLVKWQEGFCIDEN
jgi:hypothetical protein